MLGVDNLAANEHQKVGYNKYNSKSCSTNFQEKPSLYKNVFDNLPSLDTPQAARQSEIDRYLATDPDTKVVTDPLLWWFEHKHVYPRLSCMARDYISIPGKLFYYSI